MLSYKQRLAKELSKIDDCPVTERTMTAIIKMVECEKALETLEAETFTMQDAASWVAMMGEHWTLEETEKSRPTEIDSATWYAIMNMVWSDFQGITDDYPKLAKAFIEDVDVENKVPRYYHRVVVG